MSSRASSPVTKRNAADALVGVAASESAMPAASRIAGDDGIPVINHPGSCLGTMQAGVNPPGEKLPRHTCTGAATPQPGNRWARRSAHA